jgi:large subunit ribosomal protein L17
MVTQLVEHERIKTTVPKAKALKGLAEKMVAFAKRENVDYGRKKIQGILTTEFARKKLIMELAPRFK